MDECVYGGTIDDLTQKYDEYEGKGRFGTDKRG